MKIQILKNKIVTNEASFDSEEEMSSWLEYHKSVGSFGQNEYINVICPESKIQHEESPEGAEAWEETIPAIIEVIPAEYSISIIDVSAQLAQEKINDEALDYLQKTDFYVLRMMDIGIAMPEGLKELRQEARNRIVR